MAIKEEETTAGRKELQKEGRSETTSVSAVSACKKEMKGGNNNCKIEDQVCPAKKNTCKLCGKTGHFDRLCKGSEVKSIKLSSIRGNDDGPAQTVKVDLHCNDCWQQEANVLADTWAKVCEAGAAFMESMDIPIETLEQTDEITTAFDGSTSTPLGIDFNVQIIYGGITVTRTFRIYQEL